mgnify:FL=1|tara:strand:+ start:8404 stop:8619 length:216 start_codon:yes stop_codon:yes gene_type:complete
MTDFTIRIQKMSYQLCKEYSYGGTSLVEEFPSVELLDETYDSYGGAKKQEDYCGEFRLFKQVEWITIGEDS